jgi:hypothetical protein
MYRKLDGDQVLGSFGTYLAAFAHFDALQNLISFALGAPLLPQVPAGHVTPVKPLELMPAALTSPMLSMSGIAATVARTKIFNIGSLLMISPKTVSPLFQTRPMPRSK